MKPALSEQEQYFALAREDFPTFMALVHQTDMPQVNAGHATASQAQLRMAEALTDERSAPVNNKEWAKQTRVVYLSHAATKAYQVSLAIMETIEANPVYQAIFPAVKPHTRKWSEPEWRLKGNDGTAHANFICGGIDSPPLGARGDVIVLDDVGDEKNMGTAGQREKVRSTLNRVVRPMFVPEPGIVPPHTLIVAPRGFAKTTVVQCWLEWIIGRASLGYPVRHRTVMLGTRWAWDDAVDWAQEQGFTGPYMKAIEVGEDGEEYSTWPERFTLDYLKDERRKDPRSFAQQMQNEVAPEEGLVFERWWFQRRFDALPSQVAFRYESWDLASTTNRKSDWTVGQAFLVAAECPLCPGGFWHYFLPHMFRGKKSYGYVKLAIKDVYQLMGGYSIDHYAVVEKKNVGEALAGEGIDGVPLKFRGALGEGQAAGLKEKNIADVADVCRQGRVHLPSDEFLARRTGESAWLEEFERGLLSFDGVGGHTDDIVSAFCQGILEGEERRQHWQRLLMQPQKAIPWRQEHVDKVAI